MLLALDIGNSAVKGALFDGGTTTRVFHVETASNGDAERWDEALHAHLAEATVERIGLVSVVPDAVPRVEAALAARTDAPVTRIHYEMQLPFALHYDTPQTLGADRLAAAASAWVQYGAPASRSVIAIDAGTAVNYEVVDRNGVYRGGAIGAGPALVQQALRSGTAQLPSVPLTVPDDVIGTSTRTALQSGILYGFVDSVRGMVNRLTGALDDTPLVVLTGGWSSVLEGELDSVDRVVPHLVLDGVRVLLELNS